MRINRWVVYTIAVYMALSAAYVAWPARAQGKTLYIDQAYIPNQTTNVTIHARGTEIVGFSCSGNCFVLSR
jgi:hypothetical protein